MTTVTTCPTCGTEPMENARFCHGCGLPIAEPNSHAQYKQVTVTRAPRSTGWRLSRPTEAMR
jgi:hypothetical protein